MVQLGKLPIKILEFQLLWPEKINFSYIFKIAVFISYMTICAIGMIGHFVYSYVNDEFTYLNIADDMAGCLATLSAIYVMLVHINNVGSSRELLQRLSDFTMHEKPKDVDVLDKHLNFVSVIACVLLYISMFLQWVVGIMSNCPETGEISDCSFIVTAYLPDPFNIFISPYRQIFMTLQISSAFICGICAFFCLWIQVCISQFIVSRLKHLKFMLKEMLVMNSREKRRRHIKTCVLYQYNINEIWFDFNNSSKNIFLIHITVSPVVMSMIAYQLLYQFKFVNFVHLVVWNLAVLSETLMDTAYDSIPFDEDYETTKDMLLIMKRGKYAMYISAGDFAICRHVTYMTIMKTMYSYLTILTKT
ncbi:PREDICTED: uncharacterized protein LOC108563077 [Nicrophorus vespilloides]|uniref:Odorant receptor n=1 Tax=Nicrophorus vespilloides TaxID=110193 RepID=A0ABM1MRE0_NICVS|nr:PREDICTED: uncharacterized protein LOC108563077 [Nicrophorus vespilloides]